MIDILCAFKALKKTTNKKETFSVDVNCIWNKKRQTKQQLKPYKNNEKRNTYYVVAVKRSKHND